MRIGIDGYNLAMAKGTGVATYGHTLATILRTGGHRVEGVFGVDAGRDSGMREVMFFERIGREGEPVTEKRRRRDAKHAARRAILPFLSPRAAEVPLTGRVETLPLAGRLPTFDRIVTSPQLFAVAHRYFARWGRFVQLRFPDPPEIMHWTYPVPVALAGARNVYTLHDLVPLRLPYTTLDAKQAYHALLAACVGQAAGICTVSETSRADIASEFGLPLERVHNCYQASPLPADMLDRSAADDAAQIHGTFGFEHRGYFLYFGAVEPKKNVGRLIEAYLGLETDTPLVMVGGRGWRSEDETYLLTQEDLLQTEHGRRLSERIIRLGHLPRTLLLKLIRGAKAVVFPSIYEGFGLPVLEAMQLGTPVLTAAAAALPEVAGDAALLVDPYSVEDIGAALRALDHDRNLCARLAQAGPIQAERFSARAYLDRLERFYGAIRTAAW